MVWPTRIFYRCATRYGTLNCGSFEHIGIPRFQVQPSGLEAAVQEGVQRFDHDDVFVLSVAFYANFTTLSLLVVSSSQLLVMFCQPLAALCLSSSRTERL